MSTSLFEAPPPDLRKERRNRSILIVVLILLALAALGVWKVPTWYSEWSSEKLVKQIFTALQNNDFEKAYSIWVADQDWMQHGDQLKIYSFNECQQDCSPCGD